MSHAMDATSALGVDCMVLFSLAGCIIVHDPSPCAVSVSAGDGGYACPCFPRDAEGDAEEPLGSDDETDADGGCSAAPIDCQLVDGMVLGLPTADVPVSPPVVTPQVQESAVSGIFQKQIGVLNVSPTIGDSQAVVHMLAPMGMPYFVTMSAVTAIEHDMAIFFPEAYEGSIDSRSIAQIDQYLQGGGVVVMKYSEVADLKQLGGVASCIFQAQHSAVTLTDAGKARFPSLDDPAEQTIPLGGNAQQYLNTWAMTVDPSATNVQVLATFDDGSAAIVDNAVGTGHVVTFGVDWRDVVLRNQAARSLSAARGYINLFEPATDTWMLMLRDLYDATVRFGVRLHTAPYGARAAFLLSHDLDYGPSYTNAIQYAAVEQDAGATATYLAHTKYVTDWEDVAFFGADCVCDLAQIAQLGGHIGSHTVAHSAVLDQFPIGDGTEAYPSYAPVNVSATETIGGTLFGELRVSKSLIDGALCASGLIPATVGFRAGDLVYHPNSPETMERVGYRYDSTRAIGDVLTNFPYRVMTSDTNMLDTSVFEFPLVIEDQLAPRLDQRVSDALTIISANANNGAPTTILIHPDVLDYKINAEEEMLSGLPDGVRAMSIDEFETFWRARDGVTVTDIEYDDAAKILSIELSAAQAMDGLSLRVDAVVSSVVAPATAVIQPGASGNLVLLPHIGAGETLTVTLGYD
jgi:hypothetical protein